MSIQATIQDTFERNGVHFEVHEGKNGQWYWRAKRSSDIVADGGEGYSTASNARKAVRKFIKSIAEQYTFGGGVELSTLSKGKK